MNHLLKNVPSLAEAAFGTSRPAFIRYLCNWNNNFLVRVALNIAVA